MSGDGELGSISYLTSVVLDVDLVERRASLLLGARIFIFLVEGQGLAAAEVQDLVPLPGLAGPGQDVRQVAVGLFELRLQVLGIHPAADRLLGHLVERVGLLQDLLGPLDGLDLVVVVQDHRVADLADQLVDVDEEAQLRIIDLGVGILGIERDDHPPRKRELDVQRFHLLLDGQRVVGPLLADRGGGDHGLLRLGGDVLSHERQDLGGPGRGLVGPLLSLGELVLQLHLGPGRRRAEDGQRRQHDR